MMVNFNFALCCQGFDKVAGLTSSTTWSTERGLQQLFATSNGELCIFVRMKRKELKHRRL